MFGSLDTARTELETLARSLDATALSGEEALRALRDLGAIRRLTDGLLAKVAKRVGETSAHEHTGDRDAVHCYARTLGCDASEGRRAIDTAKKLEHLPSTDRAVREGKLSAKQAQMIADAAASNPRAEATLLAAAGN